MSDAQADAGISEIDLGALEDWLKNLPYVDKTRQQKVLAERAATQLAELSTLLTDVSDRLQTIQAGLASLGLPRFDPGASWEDLRDSLKELPQVKVSALASFAEGHGRILPNQATRLSKAVDAHWRGECARLARDITAPLRTLHDAMTRNPNISRTKTDALNLIIRQINAARDAMSLDPGKIPTFLAAHRLAQEHLTRALSGAHDPESLVKFLASGELRLGSLSESNLEALRKSPLADVITLKF